VDHRCAFVGSANLITSSIDTMGEVNVLIRGLHQRALWKLTESLREDVLHSRALSGAPNFLWLSRWLAWLGL
jgi:phosphatidylserine/phosphatidylglycerophosphate/cardiolipin synthase-like enzyme